MKNVLRIVAGLFGALFLISGLQWIIAPARIAEQLGMPLLEGVGLSAQIGDMGSFFITVGAMTLIGALTHNTSLVLRAIHAYCWWQLCTEPFQPLLYGAPFVMSAIVVEVSCRPLFNFRWPKDRDRG